MRNHAYFAFTLLAAAVLARIGGAAEADAAFEAKGWAATTPGGAGGRVLHVTNTNAEGPGSFREAVAAKGPRTVVFDVGGVIDLDRHAISIKEPFLTVSGETAPSPGITLIRGGISVSAHDVVLRHLRVRPGEAGQAKKSGWEADGIATGSYNIIVDHCSCTWATDENLSASGPRFEGGNPAEWREHTSHAVTFSNCIIAEGLSHATHGKGEHSKGSLIHDNTSEILIIGNLYVSNMSRNPLFKGGARGVIVNNYLYNPGNAAMHYGLVPSEWEGHDWETGQMSVVGNVLEHGPDTEGDVTLFHYSMSGPLEIYFRDNEARNRAGGDVPLIGKHPETCAVVDAPPLWPAGLEPLPAASVKEHVLENAGARPWDRDAIDTRLIRECREGKGHIIDSESEVGGYPTE